MTTEISTFITVETITTLSGATGATVIVSNGIQRAFNFNPKWMALLISILISFSIVFNKNGETSDYLLGLINGFLIYATAVGTNSILGTDEGKGIQDRNPQVSSNKQEKRKFRTRWF